MAVAIALLSSLWCLGERQAGRAQKLGVAYLPGQALYLIRQHDAGDGVPAWYHNLERIAFLLVCDRAKNAQF